MSGDQTASAIYTSLLLMLVASSLFARRLPIGQTLKMVLAWIAIFAGIFVLFTFRHQFGSVWNTVKAELSPGGTTDSNGTVRIRQNEDGHFWVDATLNGKDVRLMVDSGATTTALSVATARAANVDISDSGFPVVIDTANGVVEAQRGTVASFRVGPIERKDFSVIVSENFGDTNVVGMNFLSTLKGWRVEGGELLLNPKETTTRP
jgi:aspartyl protease family protein